MKIGLITIHYANSYGGCLQALASQAVLSKYGEVEIIDYKSPALKSTMRLLRYSRSPRCILHIVKDLARFNARKRLLQKFRSFMGRYYRLTEPCNDEAMLRQLNGKFDFFVCGSDQIWNPAVIGRLDLNYFLDFVSEGRRIAFSTSAGSYSYSLQERELVKAAVSQFSSLSFREKDFVEKVSEISGRTDVVSTLDPTLLLGKQDWLSLLQIQPRKQEDKYVFVYTLKKNKFVYEAIRAISRKLGLKVYAIDQDPVLFYRADKHVRDAGPSEFVSLIANASFVITNSFHGTAFAVNFGVPFLSINPESGSNRIKGFLKDLGLYDRFVESVSDLESIESNNVDFTRPHFLLDEYRKETFSYLSLALNSDNYCSGVT